MRDLRAKHTFVFTISADNQPAGPFPSKCGGLKRHTRFFITSTHQEVAGPFLKHSETLDETLVFFLINSTHQKVAGPSRWGRGWGEGGSILYLCISKVISSHCADYGLQDHGLHCVQIHWHQEDYGLRGGGCGSCRGDDWYQ